MKHSTNERVKTNRPARPLRGTGLGRRGYPAKVRAKAIALVRTRLAEGIGLDACAGELGISTVTLRKWLTAAEAAKRPEASGARQPIAAASPSSSRWRAVTLASPVHTPMAGLTLTTPGGYRLEGLSLDQALIALERLR